MTTQQHNAEMTVLHRNYMEGQARIKQRLLYWSNRREELVKQCGSIDAMNERQKLNYDVIQNTIEDITFYNQVLTAFALKYQQLYEKQCVFVDNIFKVKLLTEDFKKLETATPDVFVEQLKNIFDEKELNKSN